MAPFFTCADYTGSIISVQFGNLERVGYRTEVGFIRDNINNAM